jgi:hypothetical protein
VKKTLPLHPLPRRNKPGGDIRSQDRKRRPERGDRIRGGRDPAHPRGWQRARSSPCRSSVASRELHCCRSAKPTTPETARNHLPRHESIGRTELLSLTLLEDQRTSPRCAYRGRPIVKSYTKHLPTRSGH